MAQQSPLIRFEEMHLEEARRLSRGPRMDPRLYQALKDKILSLGNMTARMTRPEGTSPNTMKHRILRVAAELNTPVTICRAPGDHLFVYFLTFQEGKLIDIKTGDYGR
jgi:hypothetical protein